MKTELRLLTAMVLMTTACGNKCTKPWPVEPKTPGRSDAQRTLTLDQFEDRVYGPGPKAMFAETTAREHSLIETLIPRMLDGARAEPPADPLVWQPEAVAADFNLEVWNVKGET